METDYKYLAYITTVDTNPEDVPTDLNADSDSTMWIHLGSRTSKTPVTSPFKSSEYISHLSTKLSDIIKVAYPDLTEIPDDTLATDYFHFYIYPLTPTRDDHGIIVGYHYNEDIAVRMHYAFSVWQSVYDSGTNVNSINLTWRIYVPELYTIDNPNIIPYPFFESSQVDNDITFTDNGDGSVYAEGEASALTDFVFTALSDHVGVTQNTSFTFTGISGGSNSTYFIRLTFYDSNESSISNVDCYDETTFTSPAGSAYIRVAFYCRSGTSISMMLTPDLRISGTGYTAIQGSFNTGVGNITGPMYEEVLANGLTNPNVYVSIFSKYLANIYDAVDYDVIGSEPYLYNNYLKRWKWRDSALSAETVTASGTDYGLQYMPFLFAYGVTIDDIYEAASWSDINNNLIGAEIATYGIVSATKELTMRLYYNNLYSKYNYYLIKALGGSSGFYTEDDPGVYDILDDENSEEYNGKGDFDKDSDEIEMSVNILEAWRYMDGEGPHIIRCVDHIDFANFMKLFYQYVTNPGMGVHNGLEYISNNGMSIGDVFINICAIPSQFTVWQSSSQVIKFSGYGDTQANSIYRNVDTTSTEVYNVYSQTSYELSMGELEVSEYFGSFLDYDPYTKIQIFLPFIGYRNLDVNAIMGSTIELIYKADVVTGDCVANIVVKKNKFGTNLNSILYSFTGSLGRHFPLSQGAFYNHSIAQQQAFMKTQAAIITAGSVALGTMFGGPGVGSTIGGIVGGATTMMLNNDPMMSVSKRSNGSRTGECNSVAAYMSTLTPHLIIDRPITAIPTGFAHNKGRELGVTKPLNTLLGFTVISDIHLDSVTTMTSEDKDDMMEILRSGIII